MKGIYIKISRKSIVLQILLFRHDTVARHNARSIVLQILLFRNDAGLGTTRDPLFCRSYYLGMTRGLGTSQESKHKFIATYESCSWVFCKSFYLYTYDIT